MMTHTQLVKRIGTYLSELEAKYQTGIAREHSYRAALEGLIQPIGDNIETINDGARQQVGAPDIIVVCNGVPESFVEAKDVDVDLDKTEKTDQLTAYRAAYPNLILTNYLEFRWYIEGELKRSATAGQFEGKTIQRSEDGIDALAGLLIDFIDAGVPVTATAETLAERMAGIARQLRHVITRTYEAGDAALDAQLKAFQETLIPDLTPEQFADMYAQTLTYGFFAAVVRWDAEGRKGAFTRVTAWNEIPQTNPFLRKLFHQISTGDEFPERLDYLVDHLTNILTHADLGEILRDFGQATRQDDPVVHFYEDFLAAYDPKMRERRGVYYTPEPVVSYIVRSVDWLLREKFNRPDGLADKNTLILDPAVGTGTFLYFVIQQIYELYAGQEGAWDAYVRESLLPRIFGFELLMAPYTVAHMKLGLQLQETGYKFRSNQRLGIYLTNTLDEAVRQSETLGFAGFISHEGNQAARIKREEPIMVVLGNPPYSGHSANNGEWIDGLIRDYYFVDGEPLGERNPKWLQDDYVKFIRFGQWRVEQTGEGILAFVTNNGYLDNPTFRGMRQQLMSAFSEIYILNLHGSTKKQETAPDGLPDENVFDIQQGVAIGIFVKREGQNESARVFYGDLWGRRSVKYAELVEGRINQSLIEIRPSKPFYVFVPQDADVKAEYQQLTTITEVFPSNVLGFQTHRDSFAISFDKDEMHSRISEMRNAKVTDEPFRRKYELSDNRDWQLSQARKSLQQLHDWENDLITCYYRPFDWRYCYFSNIAMDYPRRELLEHVAHKQNLILGVGRQGQAVNDPMWSLLSVASSPVDANLFRRGGVTCCPLYLYPDPTKLIEDWDWPPGKDGRRPNLSPDFVQKMAGKLGLTFVSDGTGDLVETFGPEDVFNYIYALFHSPTYRERYAEFLRIDFPRVPLTSDVDLFRILVEKGGQLVDAHLLRRTGLRDLTTKFPVKGTNEVISRHPRYTEPTEKQPEGRVYINREQYFEGIEPEVWAFHIGGYQVLHKYLKDRKGRTLSGEEITHYQKIVVALRQTIRLMAAIDEAIPAWPLA